MAHYQIEDWRAFRDNTAPQALCTSMASHLQSCDHCLKLYLSLVDEVEERKAEQHLPGNFTSKVIEMVTARSSKEKRRERSRQLIHYTVAASITLALMAGGVFDLVAREVPLALRESTSFSHAVERVVSIRWSDQLVEAASTSLNYILNEDDEEDRSP